MKFFQKIKKEASRVVEQVERHGGALIREVTESDAVTTKGMKIVNERDLDALKAFLLEYNQDNIILLTKTALGYKDSFMSFLFHKTVIEAELLANGVKALSHPEVTGSLSLLLYTVQHCISIGEGSRSKFFLDKALRDYNASPKTANLLQQMTDNTKYDQQTDSFPCHISGFAINKDNFLTDCPDAEVDFNIKKDGFAFNPPPLDGQEELELQAVKFADYAAASQGPADSAATESTDIAAEVAALRAQVAQLRIQLERGLDSAPPVYPHSESQRDVPVNIEADAQVPPPPYLEVEGVAGNVPETFDFNLGC